MLGRVIKKIIPISTNKESITATNVCIPNWFWYISAVRVVDASIKLKITIKIVEIIIPAFHTQLFTLNVSYEKITNIPPKISNDVVRKNVSKNSIVIHSLGIISDGRIDIVSSKE